MIFTKSLREGVRRGRITCSVRFWTHPHVKVGGRYRMDEGEIEVDSIREITLKEITPDLARRSGFKDVADLLSVAKHGVGEHIYLIKFRYSASFLPRQQAPGPQRRSG
jgi:hypothetical protein